MGTDFSKKEIVPMVQNVNQNNDFDIDSKINFESILKELQDILKSPSPFTLYQKSNELKEKFADFINNITKKISEGFNSQNKTVIISMYHNAQYEKVWINNLKNYLEDSKYFDVYIYFKSIMAFEKEKQYLAKALLKMYKGVKKEDIEKFLKKFSKKYGYENIKEIYNNLKIKEIEFEIKDTDENRIERFLEKIYLSDKVDNNLLLSYFYLNLKEIKPKFEDTYHIFSEITIFYLKETNIRDLQIIDYVNKKKNYELKIKIDSEIKNFYENKAVFYKNISDLLNLSAITSVERGYFWKYIKTEIINKNYKEVKRLFYWNKDACSNRNEWALLKGNFILNEKNPYIKEINSIIGFKKLILAINKSILSPFLKPIIYGIVSEKITINKKDLLKLRYLMTLILSENYNEYKKIYNFFEDLETFLDFNLSTNKSFNINFKKIKIFTANIIMAIFGLYFLYNYSPVGVFVATILLLGSFFREQFLTFKSGIEWNFGTKTFATALLVISSFFWITNLDKTKADLGNLISKVQKVGIYNTEETSKIAVDRISRLKIGEMVADILQSKKK